MSGATPGRTRSKRAVVVLLAMGGGAWFFSLLCDITRYGDDLTVSLREGALKFYWGDPPRYPGTRNSIVRARGLWPLHSRRPSAPPVYIRWEVHLGVLFRMREIEIDPRESLTTGAYFGTGMPRLLRGNPLRWDDVGVCLAIPVWLPFAVPIGWIWWRKRRRCALWACPREWDVRPSVDSHSPSSYSGS